MSEATLRAVLASSGGRIEIAQRSSVRATTTTGINGSRHHTWRDRRRSLSSRGRGSGGGSGLGLESDYGLVSGLLLYNRFLHIAVIGRTIGLCASLDSSSAALAAVLESFTAWAVPAFRKPEFICMSA